MYAVAKPAGMAGHSAPPPRVADDGSCPLPQGRRRARFTPDPYRRHPRSLGFCGLLSVAGLAALLAVRWAGATVSAWLSVAFCSRRRGSGRWLLGRGRLRRDGWLKALGAGARAVLLRYWLLAMRWRMERGAVKARRLHGSGAAAKRAAGADAGSARRTAAGALLIVANVGRARARWAATARRTEKGENDGKRHHTCASICARFCDLF